MSPCALLLSRLIKHARKVNKAYRGASEQARRLVRREFDMVGVAQCGYGLGVCRNKDKGVDGLNDAEELFPAERYLILFGVIGVLLERHIGDAALSVFQGFRAGFKGFGCRLCEGLAAYNAHGTRKHPPKMVCITLPSLLGGKINGVTLVEYFHTVPLKRWWDGV